MKNTALSFVVVSLAIASTSFAQLPRFQEVFEIQVAPVHQKSFETMAMKIKEAADEVGSPMSWTLVQVATGKPSLTYRVVLGFDEWAERDQWGLVEGVLTEAFGEEEAARIHRDGQLGIVSETSRIWELLDDGSSNLDPNAPIANFYQVQIRHVARERVPEYREVQRQWKAAYETASDGPIVARWILRYGENPGATFRRTQPFDTWAELDSPRGPDILIEQFGEEGRRLQLESVGRMYEKTETFVSAYRPDLSRAATSPTSD